MSRVLVGTKHEIAASGFKLVKVDGRTAMEIGVYCVDGEFYAWRNICPHRAAPICQGLITGTNLPSSVYEYKYGRDQQVLRCPWHGWEFDLKTGEHMVEVTGRPVKLRGYQVEIDNDDVYIVLNKG